MIRVCIGIMIRFCIGIMIRVCISIMIRVYRLYDITVIFLIKVSVNLMGVLVKLFMHNSINLLFNSETLVHITASTTSIV